MTCRRYFISGRVQGVWFRESTRRQAEPRGITGYAVNLDDGRVEVLACGETAALDELERWLHDGPTRARVDRVEVEAAREDPPGAFTTG